MWGLVQGTPSFSDIFSPFAAIEVLVPFEARNWLSPNYNVEELSDIFHVPERVIHRSLSSTYDRFVRKWRSDNAIERIFDVDGKY